MTSHPLIRCIAIWSLVLQFTNALKACELPPCGHDVQYTFQDVVQCLESISNVTEQSIRKHFVLIGDSRIRHLFYSFTQMFPDYDFHWSNTSMLEWAGHHDNQVSSSLLNLTISFKWRPFVEESLNELITWTSPYSEAPNWIIMGMTAWHIHFNKNAHLDSLKSFEISLGNLAPILRELTQKSQILWLNQLPVADNLAITFCSKCYQNLMEVFNLAARRILRGTGVVVWDSDGQLGMEYIRSCTLNNRDDMLQYWNCVDYIHTGYVALNRRSNLLVNFVCNRLKPVNKC